jgi:hypothetical protein
LVGWALAAGGWACQHRPASSLHPGRGRRTRLPPRELLATRPRQVSGCLFGRGVCIQRCHSCSRCSSGSRYSLVDVWPARPAWDQTRSAAPRDPAPQPPQEAGGGWTCRRRAPPPSSRLRSGRVIVTSEPSSSTRPGPGSPKELVFAGPHGGVLRVTLFRRRFWRPAPTRRRSRLGPGTPR